MVEEPANEQAVRVEGSKLRCPFCHDEVLTGSEWVACTECLARHHTDCWSETGACGTCGATQHLVPPEEQVARRELWAAPPAVDRSMLRFLLTLVIGLTVFAGIGAGVGFAITGSSFGACIGAAVGIVLFGKVIFLLGGI